MLIRIARKEDLQAIASLYIQNHKRTYEGLLSKEYLDSLDLPYALNKWSKYLDDQEKVIYVAYEEETFLGFVAGDVEDEITDCYYLDSLHVIPSKQGKGIGSRLIRTIMNHALDRGYHNLSINIVQGNDKALALYQKLGAEHYCFFTDYFNNTLSHSEKLLWKGLKRQ